MRKSTYWLGIIGMGLLALVIKIRVVEIMRVPSESMLPNLLPGDYILINKLAYWKKNPRRGEVIVFQHPTDDNFPLIKRVVAIAKDRGELKDKELWIKGYKATKKSNPREPPPLDLSGKTRWEFFLEKLDGKPYLVQYERWDWVPHYGFEVSENGIIVLGDNRHHSQDSRSFGTVNLNRVVGKAVVILLSVEPYTRRIAWGRIGKRID